MTRELLLWQLRDLLGQYARGRQWWRVHERAWTEFEDALEAAR